jgi:F0F1-type ATP synthase assembly protein I
MHEEEPESEEQLPVENAKSSLKTYAKYSAIGFQMIAIIGVFTYAGYKIDENRESKTPIYTAFFSLTGVFIALYLVIRSVKNLKS